MELLKLSRNNSKIKSVADALELKRSQVVALDLPAGWTCPSAQDCKSKADRVTGKITDGAECKFRCYATSAESAFTTTRVMRWYNFDLLRKAKTEYRMQELILASLPANLRIVRIHSSGDFYNRAYFNAWNRVAYLRSDITFYGYTKQAQYLENASMPDNMRIVVSAGGRNNDKAPKVARAHVVFSKNQEYPVYTDVKSELHVLTQAGDFGLLIHGTQPAGFYKRLAQGV